MKAVILAAGRGTRMKRLTEDRPKPMVEVGKRHVLEWTFGALRRAGVNRFVVVTGYRADIVEDHFGSGERFGLDLVYLRQENPTGTAAAAHLAREAVGDEPFFLTYGDIVAEPENYARLVEAFLRDRPDGVLGVNYMEDPFKGSAVLFDDSGKVTRMIEKPPKGSKPSRWNGSGLFCFSPVLFEYTGKVPLSPRGEYELADAFQAMLADKRDLRVYRLEGYWGDIGTPEDLERMDALLRDSERTGPERAGNIDDEPR